MFTKVFSIRIDPELIKKLKMYCAKEGITITQCITDFIKGLKR